MPCKAMVCVNTSDKEKASINKTERTVNTLESFIIELNEIPSNKTFEEIMQDIYDKTGDPEPRNYFKTNSLSKTLFLYMKNFSVHLVLIMSAINLRDFKECNNITADIKKSRECQHSLEKIEGGANETERMETTFDLLSVGMEKLQKSNNDLKKFTSHFDAKAIKLTKIYIRFHNQSFDASLGHYEEFESRFKMTHAYIYSMQVKLRNEIKLNNDLIVITKDAYEYIVKQGSGNIQAFAKIVVAYIDYLKKHAIELPLNRDEWNKIFMKRFRKEFFEIYIFN